MHRLDKPTSGVLASQHVEGAVLALPPVATPLGTHSLGAGLLRAAKRSTTAAQTPATAPGAAASPVPTSRISRRSNTQVAAKTGQALRTLSAAFAERRVRKRYRAVVAGELGTLGAPPQSVRAPLSGQQAWTEWAAVARMHHSACGAATLVDLYPHTGTRRMCAYAHAHAHAHPHPHPRPHPRVGRADAPVAAAHGHARPPHRRRCTLLATRGTAG